MRRRVNLFWFFLILMITSTNIVSLAAAAEQCGRASWYAMNGKKTASGEVMNPADMTAAHRRYPFGTLVNVKNMRNGLTVSVRINDRGPHTRKRIIDVSRAAAEKLDFIKDGSTRVCISE